MNDSRDSVIVHTLALCVGYCIINPVRRVKIDSAVCICKSINASLRVAIQQAYDHI